MKFLRWKLRAVFADLASVEYGVFSLCLSSLRNIRTLILMRTMDDTC